MLAPTLGACEATLCASQSYPPYTYLSKGRPLIRRVHTCSSRLNTCNAPATSMCGALAASPPPFLGRRVTTYNPNPGSVSLQYAARLTLPPVRELEAPRLGLEVCSVLRCPSRRRHLVIVIIIIVVLVVVLVPAVAALGLLDDAE